MLTGNDEGAAGWALAAPSSRPNATSEAARRGIASVAGRSRPARALCVGMARTNGCQRLLDYQHADLRDQLQWGLVAVVCCLRMAVGKHRIDCDCRG